MEQRPIRKQPPPNQQQINESVSASGFVKDESGEPLPGVTIVIKGTTIGTSTDINGKYRIIIPEGTKNPTIIFSCVGMENKEIKYTKQKNIDVILKDATTMLKGVVVEAGIMQRNKLGFTGNDTSVTGKELKALGNNQLYK